MMEYVVGFAHDTHNVLVIEKKRPQWQAGKLNGIGGKVEDGEAPVDAMVREFREETGLHSKNWKHRMTLVSGEHKIYVFSMLTNTFYLSMYDSLEDEHVYLLPKRYILADDTPRIPNLDWILPLVMFEYDEYEPFEVVET